MQRLMHVTHAFITIHCIMTHYTLAAFCHSAFNNKFRVHLKYCSTPEHFSIVSRHAVFGGSMVPMAIIITVFIWS